MPFVGLTHKKPAGSFPFEFALMGELRRRETGGKDSMHAPARWGGIWGRKDSRHAPTRWAGIWGKSPTTGDMRRREAAPLARSKVMSSTCGMWAGVLKCARGSRSSCRHRMPDPFSFLEIGRNFVWFGDFTVLIQNVKFGTL